MGANTDRGERASSFFARSQPASNFALFAVLLAFGMLLHLTSEADWFATPLHGAVTISALFVMARPNSIAGLTALAVSWVGAWVVDMPRALNHSVLVSALVISVVAAVAIRSWRTEEGGLERRLFPYFRALVYVLYSFAVLHKLNFDYFNSTWSCAVEHAETFLYRAPLVPTLELDSLGWLIIPGSLIVEAAIPLLLAFRRTRSIGLAVAFGFHYLNGLNGHWAFSGLAPALYVAFLPPDTWRLIGDRIRGSTFLTRAMVALGVALLALPFIGLLSSSAGQKLGLVIFVLFAPIIFGLLLTESWGRHGDLTGRIAPWQLGLVAVVVLVGLSPYLGFSTRTNFAMYSNLQTEGSEWNHLFVPSQLRVFGTQDRLVELEEDQAAPFARFIDAPDGKATRTQPTEFPRLVEFEFRRAVSDYCATGPGSTPVTFVVDGNTISVADICTDSDWSSPPPPLLQKLFRFRSVETPSVCRQ